MKLEGVGAISVGGVLLQVARQIDDGNGLERALLKGGGEREEGVMGKRE